MKDTIKKVVEENFMEKEGFTYVNFDKLTELLNNIYGDRRYKVKVLASRTDNSSFTCRYRGKKFYCYHNSLGWYVELDRGW
ncbi:MAG: hypothetical protein ACOCRX_10885 [Candidatus Woesearchaeota archaeon]